MITKAQKVRLGIFITAATLILLITLSVLSLQKIFKEKDTYYIAYENISVMGLNVGSSVKYLGLNVGTVDNIAIDSEDISRVIVTIDLKAQTPIKEDVIADITTIGITGIKIIELRGGTNEAELLSPGDFIQPGTSLTEDITLKAEQIAEKINILLNNLLELTSEENRRKFSLLIDEASKTAQTTNEILRENKSNISRTLVNLDDLSGEMAVATKNVNRSLEVLGAIVESDSFRMTMNNLAQFSQKINRTEIDELVNGLNKTVQRTNRLLTQAEFIVRENRDSFYQSMQELNQAIEYLNNAARQIDEDPSVLIGGSKPDDPPDDKLE